MRNAVMLHRRRLLTAMALAAAGTSAGTSWARMAAESLAPAAGAKIVIVGAGPAGSRGEVGNAPAAFAVRGDDAHALIPEEGRPCFRSLRVG